MESIQNCNNSWSSSGSDDENDNVIIIDISAVAAATRLQTSIPCPSCDELFPEEVHVQQEPESYAYSLHPPSLSFPSCWSSREKEIDEDHDEALSAGGGIIEERSSICSNGSLATTVETPCSVNTYLAMASISGGNSRNKRSKPESESISGRVSPAANNSSPMKPVTDGISTAAISALDSDTEGSCESSDSEGDYDSEDELRGKRSKRLGSSIKTSYTAAAESSTSIPPLEKKIIYAETNDLNDFFDSQGCTSQGTQSVLTQSTTCGGDFDDFFSAPVISHHLPQSIFPSAFSQSSAVVSTLPSLHQQLTSLLLPTLAIPPKEPRALPSTSFRVSQTIQEVYETLQLYFNRAKDLQYHRNLYNYSISTIRGGYARLRLQIYTSDSDVNKAVLEKLHDGAQGHEHTIAIDCEDGDQFLGREIYHDIKQAFFQESSQGSSSSSGVSYGAFDYDSYNVDQLTTGFVF